MLRAATNAARRSSRSSGSVIARCTYGFSASADSVGLVFVFAMPDTTFPSTRFRSMSATIALVRALLFVALHPKRLLQSIAGALLFALYVWFAAVRAAPGVREQKIAWRNAWRERERKYP